MITALKLIFSPVDTWMKITAAQRGLFFVLLFWLLPLLVFTVGVEGYALTRLGEYRGEFGHLVRVAPELAIRYAAAQGVLLLAAIFIGAFVLHRVARSFHVPSAFRQSFIAIAYSFGPILLARLPDCIPALNTWICWGLGALLTAAVLYNGVALALRPDQTKGFGLYLVGVIVALFSSAVAHLFALAVLQGKMLGRW